MGALAFLFRGGQAGQRRASACSEASTVFGVIKADSGGTVEHVNLTSPLGQHRGRTRRFQGRRDWTTTDGDKADGARASSPALGLGTPKTFLFAWECKRFKRAGTPARRHDGNLVTGPGRTTGLRSRALRGRKRGILQGERLPGSE